MEHAVSLLCPALDPILSQMWAYPAHNFTFYSQYVHLIIFILFTPIFPKWSLSLLSSKTIVFMFYFPHECTRPTLASLLV